MRLIVALCEPCGRANTGICSACIEIEEDDDSDEYEQSELWI